MSKLLVYFDGELAGERQLDRERIMIGRRPDNDLHLAHSAVSGNHALIITIRNDSFLEDLNSTNGTKVNGRSIKKCLLRDGDEIRIARNILKYEFEPLELKQGGGTGQRSERLRHMENLIQSAGDTLVTHDDRLLRPATISSSMRIHAPSGKSVTKEAFREPLQARLRILSGAGAGKEMDLNRTLTTLGKPGIQVAAVTRRPKGYYLTHLEGELVPFLNGIAIDEQHHALKDRDIIEIAGIKLEFRLKGNSYVPAEDGPRAPAP